MDRVVQHIYDDDDFSVKVECVDGVPFVHIDVERYSKTVRKNILAQFEELREALYAHGWERAYSYTRNEKFRKLVPKGEVIDTFEYDDETYEVVKWELKSSLLQP
mgnify:CR=1 FL=1|tara:strand:+ start:43735 stop:44049 length:315 start_codon:yes stop_codon:yes gene_type:complete